MLVVGIDVAAEVHQVAVIDETEAVVVRPTAFAEDAAGYEKLFDLPASAQPERTLVVMEATGYYWRNLFAALVVAGYAVALVNPLRTHHFAGEELARTKTDRINCLQIAGIGAQKRPAPAGLPEAVAAELRELVRLRTQGGGRADQPTPSTDRLGVPELTRYLSDVSDVNTELAGAVLPQYPTAHAFRALAPSRLARLNYDGRHQVGEELARQLIDAAKISVGGQHSPTHQTGVRFACEDLQALRRRLRQLNAEISSKSNSTRSASC